MGGPLAGRHLLTTPGLWVGSWLTAGDADWGLYVPVHRDPATGVVLAEARVIIDPHDDVVHTRAALASHAPHHGRLTVHPTPGVDAGLALSYDVLAALGKPVPLTGYRPIDPAPAWSIAAAWILATPITHLTLLRAHLLTLRRRTGIRLILVCHRRALRAFLERELRQVEQSVAEASALLPGTEPATPQPLPAARPLANRWISLPALTPLKALDEATGPCRGDAPMATERDFSPPVIPPVTEAEVAWRLHRASAHPHLAAQLATAAFTAASTTQLDSVCSRPGPGRRDHHAPRPWPRQGCMTHPVPDWARPLLRAAALAWSIEAGTNGPLFSDPLGRAELPSLTDFADSCKLRPPQPPRPKRRRTRRGPARARRNLRGPSGLCVPRTTGSPGPAACLI
ncbi:hypothetical protein OG894_44990 (plasmid) [Streptomyces sp. NBC_01724]|uniref:hypothetical protein n=1 Tax=Streptomyces sp. NBC_01724 TaxID=2975922 RepID=UPI002E358A20|nr:hypothetical protein [Streptomyces sp. NBC_01724]